MRFKSKISLLVIFFTSSTSVFSDDFELKKKFKFMTKEGIEERQERQEDLKRQKEELKSYHERNEKEELYRLSVSIARSATQMMEKRYGKVSAYKEGLSCLSKMKDSKEDLELMKGVESYCASKQASYSAEAKKKKYMPGKGFAEIAVKELEAYSVHLFGEEASSKDLREYLLQSARQEEAGMDCSVKGVSAEYALIFGGGGSRHHLKCKSLYGRRVKYSLTAGHVAIGLGLIPAAKRTAYKQNKKESKAVKKTKFFPYSYFKDKKIHFSSRMAAAFLIGASKDQSGVGTDVGGGVGAIGGFGIGVLKKDKEQIPDYRELFSKLEMGFL